MDDATLTAAYQEAAAEEVVDPVAADEVAEEIETAEDPEDVVIPEKEEEIPEDNKKRSDLGRKISAFHKRQDKLEEAVSLIAKAFERISPPEPDPEDDEYVTKKELKKLQAKPVMEAEKYETEFKETFYSLCETHNLDDDDIDGIGKILLEKHNKRILGDGRLDGALNFERARADYFKAKEKKIPVSGGRASGVISKQKVSQKEPIIPKLDAATQSLYNFIARTDGEEAAKKRLKSLV